ncbi:hypothetical protein C8R43DRAFT_1182913 [Mycena crocata]|nr:hypothetical protein C8R43DRAFT_1182913 [Mycena crocata]
MFLTVVVRMDLITTRLSRMCVQMSNLQDVTLNDCSDSEPEDKDYWADSSFELPSDDDDGIVPDSDRVLRSHAPPAEWLNSEPKGTRVCVDKDGSFMDDYDNCDNLGSGNCVLCTPIFNQESTAQRRDESGLRVITGNDTYNFLPGESMIVRRSRMKKRAADELIFNCDLTRLDSLGEVCENMCFGLNCLNIKNSFRRETNKQTCTKNRKKNACGETVPNRCSPKYRVPPGGPAGLANQNPTAKLSCDKFPFASTREATSGGLTATRCVPATHNSRQGGKIGAFYKYALSNANGGKFKIMFDYGNGPQDSKQWRRAIWQHGDVQSGSTRLQPRQSTDDVVKSKL